MTWLPVMPASRSSDIDLYDGYMAFEVIEGMFFSRIALPAGLAATA